MVAARAVVLSSPRPLPAAGRVSHLDTRARAHCTETGAVLSEY
jgi:hypothetical protein